MKKLSKEQLKTKADISKKLEAAKTALEESVEKTNEAITAHNFVVAKYNEALGEAKQWCEEVVNTIDDYISERSEKWQEGEAAAELEGWKGEFEGFDPEEAVEEEEISADLEDGFDDLPDSVDG